MIIAQLSDIHAAPDNDHLSRFDNALGTLLHHHPAKPLAIATGHVHRPAAGMLAGIPAYICGSVCPANPLWLGGAHVPEVCDPPALMVHRVENGALASHFIAVSPVNGR